MCLYVNNLIYLFKMNGISIEGVLVSGAMVGFLLQPEEEGTTLFLCLIFVGVKITWW